MDVRLVVVRPFGTHKKGDLITDAAAIAQLATGAQAGNVVRVSLPPTKPSAEG